MAEGRKKATSNRGFASMDAQKQREIASKGGQSVPAEKRSFSRDPELAAQAGRKGGQAVAPEQRSFSQDPELAAEAGRKSHSARGEGQGRARSRGPKTAAPIRNNEDTGRDGEASQSGR